MPLRNHEADLAWLDAQAVCEFGKRHGKRLILQGAILPQRDKLYVLFFPASRNETYFMSSFWV